MEFAEVIARRRSVRHFNSKLSVSDEDVRALLDAAVTAPELYYLRTAAPLDYESQPACSIRVRSTVRARAEPARLTKRRRAEPV